MLACFSVYYSKPDTRNVIHYGPPKTVEEYFQQIGRAGRDGLESHCHLMVSESDFDRYHTDFYLGQLQGPAREATVQSIQALREYALDSEGCRRKLLLDYFGQASPFGERCGTCDNCQKQAKFGADATRDFGPLGARLVLCAVDSLKSQGMTPLVKVMTGKPVEDYRYSAPINTATKAMEKWAHQVPKNYPKQAYLKELISTLVSKGYISESTKHATVGGNYQTSWTAYELTRYGRQALYNTSTPIHLAVPDTVRQVEQKEEERRQKVLAKLEERGISRDKVPLEEAKTGDGEVLRAYEKWFSYSENCSNPDRKAQLQKLRSTIEQWRSSTAFRHRMAPGSVLADHKLFALAYTQATLPRGQHLDAPALVATGIRSKELPALVDRIGE